MGVFATRSTFRPNPIGQSVVRLEGIRHVGGRLELQISGLDILDNTPVLDIKPYLPYADALPQARSGFAAAPPRGRGEIRCSKTAETELRRAAQRHGYDIDRLIFDLLAHDPRPAYRRNEGLARTYGMQIEDLNIEWKVDGERIVVTAVTHIPGHPGPEGDSKDARQKDGGSEMV
jgi:hypothetical protein